jgi:hypothetical protein
MEKAGYKGSWNRTAATYRFAEQGIVYYYAPVTADYIDAVGKNHLQAAINITGYYT